MAFAFFLSLTLTLILSFMVTEKTLHLFEIMFIWMVIILIHHNFIAIAAVNMELFDFGKYYAANYWTFVFIRIFLIPLLFVWYFDKTLSVTPLKKWSLLPLGILSLVGVEYLSDVLDVYIHTRWNLWWSFIEWFVIFLLVNYSWIWYRNLLRKENH